MYCAPHTSPSSAKSSYATVTAILLRWDTDGADEAECYEAKCFEAMQEAFALRNYTVKPITIPETLDWDGHHDAYTLNQIRDITDSSSGTTGNLIIVCYIGHGGADGKALHGHKYRDAGPRLDLSRLQARLRDHVAADVLLVLDCCHAGFLPPCTEHDYQTPAFCRPPAHTMETLAACPAYSTTSGADHTFTRRLAGQLILHGAQSDISLDGFNTLLLRDGHVRGILSTQQAGSEYRGNVRILNCGEGSICLPGVDSDGARAEEVQDGHNEEE